MARDMLEAISDNFWSQGILDAPADNRFNFLTKAVSEAPAVKGILHESEGQLDRVELWRVRRQKQ
jgi:hypothetical protein